MLGFNQQHTHTITETAEAEKNSHLQSTFFLKMKKEKKIYETIKSIPKPKRKSIKYVLKKTHHKN